MPLHSVQRYRFAYQTSCADIFGSNPRPNGYLLLVFNISFVIIYAAPSSAQKNPAQDDLNK
jgi:hypothetical protein